MNNCAASASALRVQSPAEDEFNRRLLFRSESLLSLLLTSVSLFEESEVMTMTFSLLMAIVCGSLHPSLFLFIATAAAEEEVTVCTRASDCTHKYTDTHMHMHASLDARAAAECMVSMCQLPSGDEERKFEERNHNQQVMTPRKTATE